MSTGKRSIQNRIALSIAVLIFIVVAGFMPIRNVHAAGMEVKIPYEQTWVNDSDREPADTFEYRLTSEDGSPLPDEASGGYYSFKASGTDSGNLTLHFGFSRPGYYNYYVKPEIKSEKAGYTYQKTRYKVMIMAVNGSNGLEIGAYTIENANTGKKFDSLEYTQKYYRDTPDDPDPDPDPDNPGGNGRQGAAVNPGTPVPGDEIPDEEPPRALEPIDDSEPPLIRPDEDIWALLNLILMIVTALIALGDICLYFKRPKSDKEAEENNEVPEDEEWQDRFDRRIVMRILAVLIGIISIIVFFVTEDMTLPMEWVDEYTIWMVILFVVEIILAVLSRKRVLEDDEEHEDPS